MKKIIEEKKTIACTDTTLQNLARKKGIELKGFESTTLVMKNLTEEQEKAVLEMRAHAKEIAQTRENKNKLLQKILVTQEIDKQRELMQQLKSLEEKETQYSPIGNSQSDRVILGSVSMPRQTASFFYQEQKFLQSQNIKRNANIDLLMEHYFRVPEEREFLLEQISHFINQIQHNESKDYYIWLINNLNHCTLADLKDITIYEATKTKNLCKN